VLDEETIDRIKNDDVELMLFSFRYLASTLFGVQNLKIREEKIRAKVEEIKKRQDESVLQSVRGVRGDEGRAGKAIRRRSVQRSRKPSAPQLWCRLVICK